MNETVELLLNLVPILGVIIGFFAFAIWLIVDSYLIFRFKGKIKRGVKVWSRELPFESQQYLLSLKQDVVEYQQTLFSKFETAFIRVQDREVVIFSMPRHFHSSWWYVGYVDLALPNPDLEYRTFLPGLIFLIPFTVFGMIIFAVNFYFQTRAIDKFLETKAAENLSPKPLQGYYAS